MFTLVSLKIIDNNTSMFYKKFLIRNFNFSKLINYLMLRKSSKADSTYILAMLIFIDLNFM